MSKRSGRVFLDTNIMIIAFAYRNLDVLSLIEQVYEEIWIHQKVLEEMHTEPLRSRTQEFIDAGKWKLFNAEDD